MKRLFLDIETSLMEFYGFRVGYNINVGHHQIKEHSKITCISYKWEGSKAVKRLVWDKNQCDKELVRKAVDLIERADEVIAHNGDSFDIKVIRTRAYYHKIPMNHSIKSIDTYKEAKKLFKFSSNSLEFISLFSGFTGKHKTDFDLWVRVHKGNKKALKQMCEYCDNDVLELENVFNRMNVYIKPKTHVGEYTSDCPECGSDHTIINKHRVSASGTKSVQLQCQDCGKYHTIPESSYYKKKKIKKD